MTQVGRPWLPYRQFQGTHLGQPVGRGSGPDPAEELELAVAVVLLVLVDVAAGVPGEDLGDLGVEVPAELLGRVEREEVVELEVGHLGHVGREEAADRPDGLHGSLRRDGLEEGHRPVQAGEALDLGLEHLLPGVEPVVELGEELSLELLGGGELRGEGLVRERLERGGVCHGLTISFPG